MNRMTEEERARERDTQQRIALEVARSGGEGLVNRGERGVTWQDRCAYRNEEIHLRCIYVDGHDYPHKFDTATGG